jgi:hypothetical protein
MTLDDLTFECAPMRARFSQHECERQIATGRDYCVNCEHGKGKSTGKFRNGFNSSPSPRNKVSPLLSYPPFQLPPQPTLKKHAEIRKVIPRPFKTRLRKCANCGVAIKSHRNRCKPCEKAKTDPLMLRDLRQLRKARAIHKGRPAGSRKFRRAA